MNESQEIQNSQSSQNIKDTHTMNSTQNPTKGVPEKKQGSPGVSDPDFINLDDFDFDEHADPLSAAHAPDADGEGVEETPMQKKNSGSSPRPQSLDARLKKLTLMERVKENWIYLLGGVVVIAIGGYIISSIFSSAPTVPKRVVANAPSFSKLVASPEPVKAPVAAVPAKAPAVSTAIALPAQVAPPIQSSQAPVSQAAPGTVQSQLTSLVSQIESIQAFLQQSVAGDLAYQHEARQTQASMALQISLLQQQVSSLNTALSTQNQNMAWMAKELGKTQQELQLVLAQKMQDVQKYTLRAVVPGQAWLVNEAGQTVTLSIGTELKNYGKVVAINTNLGTVTMSSGYVFS